MADSYLFRPRGPSAFIEAVRRELSQVANSNSWKIGGDSSLIAVYRPATDAVEAAFGRGLKAQIWMERPQNGQGRCKFEVAGTPPAVNADAGKRRRESIANSMRSRIAELGLPKDVEFATGSTVAAVRMILPRIKEVRDDTEENASHYKDELAKIPVFVHLLEAALQQWKYHAS